MQHRRVGWVLVLALGALGGPAQAETPTLFRELACGDATLQTTYCTQVRALYERHRTGWVIPAQEFLRSRQPADLPAEVVYPFAGGDLLTALAVFPQATTFTTLSLEPAGALEAAPSSADRERFLQLLRDLVEVGHDRTDALEKPGTLPVVVALGMAGLAAQGYEPVSVRSIGLGPDGEVVPEAGPHHVEVTFREAGRADAPLRVWRHFHADLEDRRLASNIPLLRHLEAKRRVAVLVKAAGRPAKEHPGSSAMLWSSCFSQLRTYLLQHLTWMVSDFSGPPPRLVRAAGLEQEAFGQFEEAIGVDTGRDRDEADLRRLFARARVRNLPFRLGYPDRNYQNHVIITRRAVEATPSK